MAGSFMYKLEFNYDENTPSDASCYIQLRDNPPIYRRQTKKEDYDILPEDQKHEFLTGIFNISGIVEVSSTAYRVWIMKSPAYTWQEVMLPTLHFIKDWYQYTTLEQMQGSANPDGSGFTLANSSDRRQK